MSRIKDNLLNLLATAKSDLLRMDEDIKTARKVLAGEATLKQEIIDIQTALQRLDATTTQFVTCKMCSQQNWNTVVNGQYCGNVINKHLVVDDSNPMSKIGYGRGDDVKGPFER